MKKNVFGISLANAAAQLLYKVLQVFPPEGTQVPQGQRPSYILNPGQYTYPFQFKVFKIHHRSSTYLAPCLFDHGLRLASADVLVATIQQFM